MKTPPLVDLNAAAVGSTKLLIYFLWESLLAHTYNSNAGDLRIENPATPAAIRTVTPKIAGNPIFNDTFSLERSATEDLLKFKLPRNLVAESRGSNWREALELMPGSPWIGSRIKPLGAPGANQYQQIFLDPFKSVESLLLFMSEKYIRNENNNVPAIHIEASSIKAGLIATPPDLKLGKLATWDVTLSFTPTSLPTRYWADQ